MPVDSRARPWTSGGGGAVVVARLTAQKRVRSRSSDRGAHLLRARAAAHRRRRRARASRARAPGRAAGHRIVRALRRRGARGRGRRTTSARRTSCSSRRRARASGSRPRRRSCRACRWWRAGTAGACWTSCPRRRRPAHPAVAGPLADTVLGLLGDPDRLALARLVGESWRARLAPEHVAEIVRGLVPRGARCVAAGSGRSRWLVGPRHPRGSPAVAGCGNWARARGAAAGLAGIDPGCCSLAALVVWAMYALLVAAGGDAHRLGRAARRLDRRADLDRLQPREVPPGEGVGDRRDGADGAARRRARRGGHRSAVILQALAIGTGAAVAALTGAAALERARPGADGAALALLVAARSRHRAAALAAACCAGCSGWPHRDAEPVAPPLGRRSCYGVAANVAGLAGLRRARSGCWRAGCCPSAGLGSGGASRVVHGLVSRRAFWRSIAPGGLGVREGLFILMLQGTDRASAPPPRSPSPRGCCSRSPSSAPPCRS